MVRSNVKMILGVKISKGMPIEDLSKNLSTGVEGIEDDPELKEKLFPFIAKTAKLVAKQAAIQAKAIVIAILQAEIVKYEALLSTAIVLFEKSSQRIVGVIGSMGGSQPPYSTAGAESTPLINSVTQAKATLDEIKSKLEEETEKLSDLSQEFKQSSEENYSDLISAITEDRGIEFDPTKENFIYS